MPKRKNTKSSPTEKTEVRVADVFVAKNRGVEPFIKSFVAKPEHVAQESLGTLAGLFSVTDRSESSSYIVNALASIAKREYFANPHRGAVESFEAALHRMNQSLAELVKEGQADWMGSLHGAIIAIEDDQIHFSVAGEAKILLFREDTLSDISEGLASEEASRHPMKTFVEISSGKLVPGDCAILLSPEALELFSADELERSARRLAPEKRFFRFLETAMINELRSGAAIVLEADAMLSESSLHPIIRKPHRKAAEVNAFSAATFDEAEKERLDSLKLEAGSDIENPDETPYRKKHPGNGEIYIQGDAPDMGNTEHPTVTRVRWITEDILSSIKQGNSRLWSGVRRRTSVFLDASAESIVNAGSGLSRSVRNAAPKWKKPVIRIPKPSIPKIPSIRMPKIPTPSVKFPTLKIPAFKNSSAETAKRISFLVGRNILLTAKSITGFLWKNIRTSFAFLSRRFLALPPKHQILTAAGIAFILTFSGIWVYGQFVAEESESPAPVLVVEEPQVQEFPPEQERNASLSNPEKIPISVGNIVTPIFLKDSLFIATREGISDISGTLSGIPEGESIRLAAGMDDLNIIFLYTEAGNLYSFSPNNKSFTKNTVSLPGGFRVSGMGTFLTYLYFLEEATGNVYRFPRAEGGFGQGTLWTKETPGDGIIGMGVSENIYFTADSSVSAFFRGKKSTDFSFETPATPFRVTSICSHEDATGRFAIVDAAAKRVIIYSSGGSILSQHFNDSFGDIRSCSMKNDGKSIAISTSNSIFTLELP